MDGVEGACGLRVDAHVAHAVVREGPGRLGEVGVPVEGAGAWWLGTQEAAADGKEAKRYCIRLCNPDYVRRTQFQAATCAAIDKVE